MFNSKNSDQQSIGSHAENVIQVGGNLTITESTDYSEVRQIFMDLYNANNYQVQMTLMNTVQEKIDSISYKLLDEIEKIRKEKNIEDIQLKENMSSVSTQMLANQCLQQSVYKDKEDVTEILAKLLAEKVTSENQDYLIEDAIDSLKYLSSNDINFIKFFYGVVYSGYAINFLGQSYAISNYYDQISESTLEEDQKNSFIDHVYEQIVKLYKNIGRYFSTLEPQKVDYSYLMSKGWFYVNYLHFPDPIEHLSKVLKKQNGVLHTKEEIQELFPDLVNVWETFTQGGYQANPLSAIGQLIGRKTTESLLSDVVQNSFKQP
ncbi:hypothetical protein MXM84_06930 [Acinetobacter pittii]|uniref:LPO_1073/Vpar_1526 family protein n=1 Tax=Acinetobacter calcoaceticus/baumannii complex TaxID=909768 RepID=UPI0012DB2F30|nr:MULTISPECIES: LPO_1073/Vpar_1526 family protein [Acinetobacter calcoaceticus/baumannii complex]MEB6624236.1 hypothetical protein [Acinetobacter pittii]